MSGGAGAGAGGGKTRIQFAVGYFAFVGFLIYISNLSGLLFISGSVTPPPTPSITDVGGNISYFIAGMLISSQYQLLYILILTPLSIGMFIVIYEMATMLIP
jgi:hypothetical protein